MRVKKFENPQGNSVMVVYGGIIYGRSVVNKMFQARFQNLAAFSRRTKRCEHNQILYEIKCQI